MKRQIQKKTRYKNSKFLHYSHKPNTHDDDNIEIQNNYPENLRQYFQMKLWHTQISLATLPHKKRNFQVLKKILEQKVAYVVGRVSQWQNDSVNFDRKWNV